MLGDDEVLMWQQSAAPDSTSTLGDGSQTVWREIRVVKFKEIKFKIS